MKYIVTAPLWFHLDLHKDGDVMNPKVLLTGIITNDVMQKVCAYGALYKPLGFIESGRYLVDLAYPPNKVSQYYLKIINPNLLQSATEKKRIFLEQNLKRFDTCPRSRVCLRNK